MKDCLYYQSLFKAYQNNELSLKDEEDFSWHLKECKGCREELEMEYIIEYGLEDSKISGNDIRYSNFIEGYDFIGLVDSKLSDSIDYCEKIRRNNFRENIRLIVTFTIMLFTLACWLIVRFV